MQFRNLFRVLVFAAFFFPVLLSAADNAQYGSVTVTSRPSGAEVFIDGEQYGVTPSTIPSLSTGTHRVVIRLAGYQLYSGNVSVVSGKNQVVQARLLPIDAEPEDDGTGKKRKKVEGIIRSDFFGQTRYYAGAAWAFGNYKSMDFAAGMVHRRLNLELGYSLPSGTIDCGGNFLPTRDQKDIWIHHHSLEHAITGRVGLVVGQSEQVCLVTQLGYTSLMMKGFKCPYNETPKDQNHKSHMSSGSIGFRLDYMLTKWFALTATTELDFRLGQDDYVKDIIDKASVSMNDWATGLRFKVGATFVL